MTHRLPASLAAALLLLPAACGVTFEVADDGAVPASVAVLPLSGPMPAADRELARDLLREKLSARSLQVLDNAAADRLLSEAGLMTDPEAFDAAASDPAAACAALGVDGVVVGDALAESDLELLLFYRRGVGGHLRLLRADGAEAWGASYTASRSGGLLLRSGQVISAIADHLEKGSSAAFVALLDEYLDAVLDTLPERDGAPGSAEPPSVADVQVEREADRTVVDVLADPRCRVVVDLAPGARGVPAFEVVPGRYRAVLVRAEDEAEDPVSVLVEDRFGHRTRRDAIVAATSGGMP